MSSDQLAPATTFNPSDRPPDEAPSFATTSQSPPMANPVGDSMAVDSPIAGTSVPATAGIAPISYAGAVLGERSNRVQEMTSWTPIGEHDLVPSTFNGEPELKVSDGLITKLSAPWKRSLVVRTLGIQISFTTFSNKIKTQWRPTGALDILVLGPEYYLVKLSNDTDYFRALTEGPWTIFDHYLIVQQWTPSFRLNNKLPNSMIVWVQLPAFPVHFYHREVLFSLGNMIGRTIKLDYHTLHQQRARFARIAVEIDLSKPLVTRIRLDGQWQYLEYENLPVVCFECGKIGHTESSCPNLMAPSPPLALVEFGSRPDSAPATQPEEKVGYGPWLQVTRRSRRGNRNTEKGNSGFGNGENGNQGKGEKGKSINKEGLVGNDLAQGRRVGTTQRTENTNGGNFGKDRGGFGKGKGKVNMEAEGESLKSKGILGSSPQTSNSKEGPAASKAQGTKKAHETNGHKATSLVATKDSKNGPIAGTLTPPTLTDVAGPSGTSIQIVNIPQAMADEARRTEDSPISVGQRDGGGDMRQSVYIQNQMSSHQANTLLVHCRSKDDDLGIHYLKFNSSYKWKFTPIPWTTLFWCYLAPSVGARHVSFEAYNQRMGDQGMGYPTDWIVREDGVYRRRLYLSARVRDVLVHRWQSGR
ncbi:unnamed protein product [Linum tenue]|uniref:CCHC-type domain-containing protein n=1 Tax=Linum tenue TaxID=586396 RepID=A0AAV0N4Z2_9ROSI|nr:unnamed protein product [Linum tenue]